MVIRALFNQLRVFFLGWRHNTLPCRVRLGLMSASLGQESELCQEASLGDVNGPYECS